MLLHAWEYLKRDKSEKSLSGIDANNKKEDSKESERKVSSRTPRISEIPTIEKRQSEKQEPHSSAKYSRNWLWFLETFWRKTENFRGAVKDSSNLIIAAATIASALIAWQYTKYAKVQMEIMEEQLKLSAANLTIKEFTPEISNKDGFFFVKYRLVIHNGGYSMASNIHILADHGVLIEKVRESREIDVSPNLDIGPPGSPPLSAGGDWPIDDEVSVEDSGGFLSSETRQGETHIFWLKNTIRYDDVF